MTATGVAEKIKGVVTAGVNALGNANRARMKAPDGGNPFLTGIHEPLQAERTFEDLEVRIDDGVDEAIEGLRGADDAVVFVTGIVLYFL